MAGTNLLHVHFLLDLPAGAYGLPIDPSPIQVHGGTRIVGIAVVGATPSTADPKVLDIEVDQQGDYSPYLLTVGWVPDEAGVWRFASDDLDRPFSVAPINFRPGCPVDFDCAPLHDCPPALLPEPALDYLARDYASLRQMLLDLVAQRNPGWTERSPADVGIALLELFAYEGDHLSYFQDAVDNEAYLDTARQRSSAHRRPHLSRPRSRAGRRRTIRPPTTICLPAPRNRSELIGFPRDARARREGFALDYTTACDGFDGGATNGGTDHAH